MSAWSNLVGGVWAEEWPMELGLLNIGFPICHLLNQFLFSDSWGLELA